MTHLLWQGPGAQFGKWLTARTLSVLSAFVVFGLAIDCEPAKAQGTGHPPIINTTQWTLGAPVIESADSNGNPGNSASFHANFSPDGTLLLFYSSSTNLVAGATNGLTQLYVKNLLTHEIRLVSADGGGNAGDGTCFFPNNSTQVRMLSPDGTKVVFESSAANFGSGANGMQIFLKDLTGGGVTLVSADGSGIPGNNSSIDFSFSPDGTKVVFDSSASNLVPGASGQQIYIKDLTTQIVTLVSASVNGNAGDSSSLWPVFSPDGNEVAFVSAAGNLVTGGSFGQQIFVKNLTTQEVTLVSADISGKGGNNPSFYPMFSPDGAKVLFNSSSTTLVPEPTSGHLETYVKDLTTSNIALVSSNSNGDAANNDIPIAVFSADGTMVGFYSPASNLVSPATSNDQVFVKDLLTGAITLASTDAGGAQGNGLSTDANFSPDHTALGFDSNSSNFGVAPNGPFEIIMRPIFTPFGAVVDAASATTLTTAGQLSFSDADASDTHTASVVTQSGDLGTLTATVSQDTTGTGTGGVVRWNYQVDETSVHALTGSAADTFVVTLTDSQGCAATATIVVTDLLSGFSVVSAGSAGAPTSTTSTCQTTAATATGVVSSANPSVFGQAVTFTATVSALAPATGTPTGTVTFLDGGSAIGTGTLSGGVATFTTSALAVGSHTITTSYGGDANFIASAGSLTGNPQVVNQANSSTAVTSSQNPSGFGQSVTFTATVSAVAPGAGTPTGTVTFLDGGSPVGTGNLSGGIATFTTSALTVGSHTVTTSYGGDGNFNGSSGSLTGNPQVVSKPDSKTAISSSSNPSVFGQAVTFTAAVSAVAPGTGTPTGTVTFLDAGSSVGTGTLIGGIATFTTSALAVGSHTITTSYGGDGSFNGNTAPLTGNPQVVSKSDSAMVIASSANPAVFGQAVTFTATVSAVAPGTGTPTGTVAFFDGGTTIGTGTLSGGVATLTTSVLAVSSHTIATSYGGDGNFNGSSGSLTGNPEMVSKAATSTAVNSSANPSILNQSLTFTATVSVVAPGAGSPTGTITFSDGATTLATVPLNSGTATFSTSSLAVNAHSITGVYSGDGNFSSSNGSLAEKVGYSICVLYDQTRGVHGGATFPIKLTVCDGHGVDVSSSSLVLHATAVTAISGFSGTPDSAGNANPDSDFRFDGKLGATGGYIFNLGTGGLAAGTYSLQFIVGNDPVTHAVLFGVAP